jgi:carboxymethylenebutenolidase
MRSLVLIAVAACLLGWTFGQACGQAKNGEIEGKKVSFSSGKITVQGLEFDPGVQGGPYPAVIVVPGDFGLSPWAQRQCGQIAKKGYHVLALDLYRGELPKNIEEAHILGRGLEDDRVHKQVILAVDRLAKMAEVRKDAIGILGWDMGGGYALDAALMDKRLKAAVNCYGRVTTDPKKLVAMEASLLCLAAGKDLGTNKDVLKQFKAALKKAGKDGTTTIHVYPNAHHGFLDPDSPYDNRGDDKTIKDAWKRIDEHLAKALNR